jgi:radical SAM protein with 4Fe4S-binding SPASM domain
MNEITIQWNITDECEFNCNYCYLKQYGKFTPVNSNIVLSEIKEFRRYFDYAKIYLTGGNPMLHKDFEKIVETLYEENTEIKILGNPIKKNLKLKIQSIAKYIAYYQLSLDGAKGHLLNRGTNNLNDIQETVDLLNNLDIKPIIMLTLTSANSNEVIAVIEESIKRKVHSFTFSRVVSDKKYCNNSALISDYKAVLGTIFNFLVDKDVQIFNFKDNLWKLFLYEKGLYTPSDGGEGCGVGVSYISIMPNGDVYPCSRIPINIGNLQDTKLIDIWKNNSLLSEFRNFDSYKKCRTCSLIKVCRGCPAIAYAETGDCFEADPYCWK